MKPLVHIEEVDDSSSGDDVPASKSGPTKRRRVHSGPDPQTHALQLATIQLLTNLTKTADTLVPPKPMVVPPKPAGVPVGAKPDQIGGAVPRSSKFKTTCFYCADSFTELREHDCQQKRDKVLTCSHCRLPVKAKSFAGLYDHMSKCDQRSCGKCKTKAHSFHFCPNYQCFVCKKYGHTRILHKWGTDGAALIARHSQDEADQ
jgi:hypothetical protein